MQTDIEEKIDFDEYSDFLKTSRDSTFYHSAKHLSFLAEILNSKPNFITVRENNKLIGVMPFFVKESIYGKVINSLPFFGSYGGFISENSESQKQILEQMNIFNKKNDVLSSVIIAAPFTQNNQIYEKYYCFHIKESRLVQCLVIENKTETSVWKEFEQRVRRAIRKSAQYHIEIIKAELDKNNMLNFYQMHKRDMEAKKGRPKPFEFFTSLKNNFFQGEDYDIFLAKKDDKEIAYLLVFYSYPFTEYYMPAYDSELKHMQGPSLLIWESIKTSIRKKMNYYNFGGTWKNQDELYLFKRGWNATDFPYNYYIYGDLARARKIGLNEIKNQYQNFYVFSYDDIQEI